MEEDEEEEEDASSDCLLTERLIAEWGTNALGALYDAEYMERLEKNINQVMKGQERIYDCCFTCHTG